MNHRTWERALFDLAIDSKLLATTAPGSRIRVRDLLGAAFGDGTYEDAAKIFADLVNDDTFVNFLTLPACERID